MARPRTGLVTAPAAPPADVRAELAADGMLSVAAAVEFSGLSRSDLYRLMAAGALPYAERNGRRLVPRKALVRYLSGLDWHNVPDPVTGHPC